MNSPEIPAIPLGILLSNLGSPSAPTTRDVRRYLRQFLGDSRVVELPRWQWTLILNLFILPFRPRRSARAYAQIWANEGSPLILSSLKLGAELEQLLTARGLDARVRVGMSYGDPSMASALEALRGEGCTSILHLPLFPQNSGTTTGAAWDAFARALSSWRRVPTIAQVDSYATHPSYIEALARSVESAWADDGAGDHLVISFHGIPERYVRSGDVYPEQCEATAEALATRLGLDGERWTLAYQSRFGREPWIGPATDEVLLSLAGTGCRRVDVLCPGFAVDCLETLEEVAIGYRELFESAGGERLRYLPALNDRSDHVEALAEILRPQLDAASWRRDETINHPVKTARP